MRIYENPLCTAKNRGIPRSYYIPSGISEHKLLNGEWKFAYFERDIDVPTEIKDWNKIVVPSCWQLKGFGNPNYTNVSYPYPCDPPYVPDDNPCGIYERELFIDKKWGRIYLVLEGVSSCAFIKINGTEIGFTQGSHLQAEFDITDFVEEGNNILQIKVLKWCCGSYLEDQDFFRFNGIFRDIYILQRPLGHIGDVLMIPTEDTININIEGMAKLSIYENEKLLINTEFEDAYTYKPENPIKWNAEKPFLYTVNLERNGEIIELKAGLRSIKVSGEYELLINGESVTLHGVNHHDTSKFGGWCMTKEEIRKDLELMKELNINCIRTSHYPPQPYLMQLCDEMGFYVILETDLESHGFINRRSDSKHLFDIETGEFVCTMPEWKNEFVDRMRRAVEMYKNFPSVIMWSTGNESAHGSNHEAMIEYARNRDSSRLIHAEDATRKGDHQNVDVFSWMYPGFEFLENTAKDENVKQPIFICEYAHAMGNGPGDVCLYNEIFDKYKKIIGGCVWEWADHVIVDRDGIQRYGGDFEGELTNDGNFCCDGVVFADRGLKAGSYEVKTAYQPIKTEFKDNILSVYNRLDFTNLNEYEFIYEIECDGKIIESMSDTLSVKPHESTKINIEYNIKNAKYGAHLNCYLKKNDKTYATTQHNLKIVESAEINTADKLVLIEDELNIYAKGNNFNYTFSKHYGGFTSLIIGGEEQLSKVTKLSALRAPTDNERNVRVFWENPSSWRGENLECGFSKIYSCEIIDGSIAVQGSLAGVSRMPFAKYQMQIDIYENGRMDVKLNCNIRDDAKWLPRFGFEFVLNHNNPEFEYYARGPIENYCDMKNASIIGGYTSTPEKEYVNYVRPQEHGNHIDAKMLKIGKFKFLSESAFEFNVSKYSIEELYRAEHTDELIPDGKTHLRIDYRNSGVGSNSCGPELPEEYRLSEKEFDFKFTVIPASFMPLFVKTALKERAEKWQNSGK